MGDMFRTGLEKFRGGERSADVANAAVHATAQATSASSLAAMTVVRSRPIAASA